MFDPFAPISTSQVTLPPPVVLPSPLPLPSVPSLSTAPASPKLAADPALVDMLAEMFPTMPRLQLTLALRDCGNDVERTISYLLGQSPPRASSPG